MADDALDIPFIQGLCDRFASEFGHNVSVMGKGGVILASNLRERIGNVHASASRVMAGEVDEVLVSNWQAMRSATMRPGCNTALDFRGQRVANLGVAGNPKRARKFAQIIKFCILSLMEAHAVVIEQQRAEAEERRKAIRDIADRFRETVQNILPTVEGNAREVTATANSLLAAVSASCSEARDIAVASEQASAEAVSVTENAGQLACSIDEVNSQTSGLTRIVLDARAKAERTNSSVASLAAAAGRIGAAVEIIRKIAAQTNLLALNASIKSARAGVAGKGFAVVAAEVTALAKRTAEATGEIGTLIETIQQEVTVAVGDINDIAQVVGHVEEISSTVAAAMTEQGAATAEIVRSIEHVAANNGAINDGMRRLNGANGQVEVALGGMCDVSARLEKLSGELAAALDQFTDHLEIHQSSSPVLATTPRSGS